MAKWMVLILVTGLLILSSACGKKGPPQLPPGKPNGALSFVAK